MSQSRFYRFEKILDKFMPRQGEGETMASQIATAVNKIGYRWFNDGDTINSDWSVQSGTDEGGTAQFGNWLVYNVPEASAFFSPYNKKFDTGFVSDGEYEDFLYNMYETLLNLKLLSAYDAKPKRNSIYNAKEYGNGLFKGERDDDQQSDYEEDSDWDE